MDSIFPGFQSGRLLQRDVFEIQKFGIEIDNVSLNTAIGTMAAELGKLSLALIEAFQPLIRAFDEIGRAFRDGLPRYAPPYCSRRHIVFQSHAKRSRRRKWIYKIIETKA